MNELQTSYQHQHMYYSVYEYCVFYY